VSLSRRAAWVLLCAGLAIGLAIAWRIPQLLVDEMHYGPQIRAYMEGRLDFDPLITMIPTYHVLVAAVGKFFGAYSDRLARDVSLAGSLLLLPFAWRLARVNGDEAPVRVAQSFFCPLLFPYFFLIYTDGWSLVAFAALVHFTRQGRFGLAAVAGALGIALRQDFVVWVAMAWAMAAIRDEIPPRVDLRRAAHGAARAFPFALVLAAFAAFVAWNGGVAVGDRSRHPGGINLGNVYLMLAYGWLLFLPVNIASARAVLRMLRRPAVVIACVAAFAFYCLTYSNPHEYNQVKPEYFLHNGALHAMDAYPMLRAPLFLPAAWMALTAVHVARQVAALRIPLAVGLASAALHPLVEPRYYLPVFLLFNLWRPAMRTLFERAMLAAYIAGALFLLYGIQALRFFP
jgi:alpha-1,2-glucosyltransferase